MTDKQFEYILKSLKNAIILDMHEASFSCNIDDNTERVVHIDDVDGTLYKRFNEIMEDDDSNV